MSNVTDVKPSKADSEMIMIDIQSNNQVEDNRKGDITETPKND